MKRHLFAVILAVTAQSASAAPMFGHIAVPDGGATLGLLAIGAAGLYLMRRKK